jgi:hypothetical protein
MIHSENKIRVKKFSFLFIEQIVFFLIHFRKVREKKIFFHAFSFFSRIFGRKKNFMFVKNKPLFSTIFFARAPHS